MKNKKTLFAVILILFLVIGVTIAYFTSSASFENVFNTGTYKVVTTEVFESPSNWMPGQEIPKTITTTNEGTIPAAVRVKYTEKWEDLEGNDITSTIDNDTAIVNLDNTREWIKEGDYYYYSYILEPNDTTSSFMKSVVLNSTINDVECTPSQDGLTKTCESTNPALGAKYILTITKETVQSDKYQEVWNTQVEIGNKPAILIINGTKGNLQPGDVVGIGETEDFYVLSSDNSENGKTLLLSKYNLLVGNIKENDTIVGTLNDQTPGYGLQSVDAAAGYSAYNSYGSVTFANTNYWIEDGGFKDNYFQDDMIYYDQVSQCFRYNSNDSQVYTYVYDENSNIYQYISGQDGYVNKLKAMGAPNTITGRLLSYEEANDLINVIGLDGNSIIFDGTNDYWLGSASGLYTVAAATNEYGFIFHFDIRSYITQFGIRPVIEVPTSEIGY